MTQIVSGTGVVAGVIHAPAVWFQTPSILIESLDQVPAGEREAEADRLRVAVETVAAGYEARAARAEGEASSVLAASAALVRDRGWLRPALADIANGRPATLATVTAIDQFVVVFQKVGGVVAERVTDLRDIRSRIIARLTGQPEPGVPSPAQPSILLADDLAPADTADLDPEMIIALATRLGGPTSHTAIIARQRGLPCLVAAADLGEICDGEMVVLDGDAGTISRGVSPADVERQLLVDARRRAETEGWAGPARTVDGVHVQLLANVADGATAALAADAPVEGVGLFRTEFGFLGSTLEPTVEAQAEAYGEVLDAFLGRKVVIRTLDAGTDKPVPFASMADEPNPALGVRGHRLTKARPGLLTRQLDAIALAADGVVPQPWVMAPMISTVDEAAHFASLCRRRGLKAGIMVEVPAVALLADQFLAEVDFVSVGTNDLTQYVMAADRLAPELAALTDPWQPAVLRLIEMTTAAGARARKPVGICGEAAADPPMACVLLGLGVDSLSMAPAAVPAVGVEVAKVTLEQCRAAARAALAAPTAEEAREAAVAALAERQPQRSKLFAQAFKRI